MKYSDVEVFLNSIQNSALLFEKHNSFYSFYQEYSYGHLDRFIDGNILEKFFDCAENVLCKINPEFDLDKDSRFLTKIYNKGNTFSTKLRVGIATFLAMFANRAESQRKFQPCN